MATDSELESLSSGLTRSISTDSAPEEPDVEFTDQISQLQEMVQEMRDGFTTAMQALAKVQYGDQVLKETVDSNKAQYERQLADVVQMVLALKTEFGGMVGQLEVASQNQKSLQNQVQMLQFERDILLEELEKDGAISSDVRAKYHSGRSRPNGLNKTSDSTSLAVLLERAQTAFQNNNNHSGDSSHNNSQVTSDSGVNTCQHGDLSSCEEATPPPPQLVSPRVQSYISGLGSVDPDHVEDIPLDEHYDSDSSLTAAANKSLDLSRSLGDKCSDLAALDSSDEEKPAECVEEKIVPEMADKAQSTPKDEELYEHSSPCEVSPPRSVAPHERNARETQRSRIAREILETEKKYCSNMWTIIDHFAVPLKQANILSTKEVATMFPQCLWRIYGHHCLFLQKLENRLANWKWQCVLGDIFAQFIDSSQCDLLTQYQLYVNEFPLSLHQIRKSYRHSTRFKKFLKACHRQPCCGGLDIGAYLLTPIQRMPRYVLLLKSLLKFTDLEHPDHYYIEQSLQKLNSFLTELNESITNSMQAVAEDDTPKPKRKLRAHSMRTTSGSSYVGQGRLTISNSALPATRIISRVSEPDTHASYHRGENLQDISDISCIGSPRISLSNNTPMASPNYGATLPGKGRDTTFAFGRDSDSSIREERRRRLRQRRPHSAMDYAEAPRIVYPEEDREWMNGEGRAGPGRNKRACRPSQRPFSMLDRLSGDSFRSQGSSEYSRPQHLSQATSQESLNTLASNALSESVAHSRHHEALTRASYPNGRPYVPEYNTLPSRGRLTDREQHRALQQQQQQQQQQGFGSPALNDLLHQSMPRLNQDFGIYGDNDDENCVDDSLYLSPRSAGNTARLQHLPNSSAVMQSRSKSHGDGLHRDADLDLSQNQLNMALAQSLAKDHMNGGLPRKVSTPYVDPRTRIGLTGRRPVHPAPINRPVRLKDNLWEEPSRFGDVSIADSTLNESTATLGRGKDRRKKKDKGKKNHQLDTSSMMDVSTTDGDKKKKSFSFKNIFFRKRKLEQTHKPPFPTVGDVDCTPEANKVRESIKDDHPTPANQPVDAAAAMSHDVVREQAAPSDDTVYVEKVEMQHAVELESYEDENGDPCSAV